MLAYATRPIDGIEFMSETWDKLDVPLTGFSKPGIGDRDTPWPSYTTSGSVTIEQLRAMQEWHYRWAVEAFRVLKPGGYLLAFSAPRTVHRMACAFEEAGFDIRDCIQWVYAQGFPKSLDASKAIDKAAGADREELWSYQGASNIGKKSDGKQGYAPGTKQAKVDRRVAYTAPSTDLAKKWDGWGTTLKPAYEPVVVARKPLEGTLAQNLAKWGVGALNIDACRVPLGDGDTIAPMVRAPKPGIGWSGASGLQTQTLKELGRWPTNFIMSCECTGYAHDPDCPAAIMDAQSGEVSGASRFFYVAKASRQEREYGLDDLPSDTFQRAGPQNEERFAPTQVKNSHPTVKPVSIMQYLCRLVTPPDGLILDPFLGSGTTGVAAVLEGFRFVGCEREEKYIPIAEGRIRRALLDLSATPSERPKANLKYRIPSPKVFLRSDLDDASRASVLDELDRLGVDAEAGVSIDTIPPYLAMFFE